MGETVHITNDDMERNFLDLYMEAVGVTEVPEQFHRWVALSLIAACLGDRVWVERMAYKRLYPNQYIFLIGDTAAGKGTAMGLGKRVLDDMHRRGHSLNYYRGAMTRAGIQDELDDRWKKKWREWEDAMTQARILPEPTGVDLFFMAPELGAGTGVGPQAKDLIKFLTDIWEGDVGRFQERTRTGGSHEFENPCLNCIVGSTPEWAREVVDINDLNSGFWARVVCVMGRRDFALRVARPDTSHWVALLPVLSWRLWMLMGPADPADVSFSGPMHLSPEAERHDIEWYMTRPEPEDDLYKAHWNRQPEMVMKIAMLLRMADFWDLDPRFHARFPPDGWREIQLSHWRRAMDYAESLMHNAVTFIGASLNHTHNWRLVKVEEVLKRQRRGIPQKPNLLSIVSRHGIKSRELEVALQALEDEEKIRRTHISAGNFMVEWTAPRR